jgi:hypothetical protein
MSAHAQFLPLLIAAVLLGYGETINCLQHQICRGATQNNYTMHIFPIYFNFMGKKIFCFAVAAERGVL